MPQSSVSNDPAIAREGQAASINRLDTVSYLNLSGGDIPYGRVVVMDTADGSARLPALTGEITGGTALGITIADSSKAPNAGGYADNDQLPILRKGQIYMIAEDAVAAGGDVFVRFSASGGESLGRVRSDADTSDAVALPGARYLSSTSGADELVIVELNLN